MKIKNKIISIILYYLHKRKVINSLRDENLQLLAIKEEINNSIIVYDPTIPNVNTPFDLIEFNKIREFTIIDESVIKVVLPYETLVLTIEDDYHLLAFLKKAITLCGVCTIGRERLLLSKTTEFYLEVDLHQTIDLVKLNEVIYNATWHIREHKTTYDLKSEN